MGFQKIVLFVPTDFRPNDYFRKKTKVKKIKKDHSKFLREHLKRSHIKYFPITVELGYKNEAYFTEEEMLEGFKIDPNELTGWELEQYNKH